MQCRAIAHTLKPRFRLVFAEAPFPSLAGPDVLTVYAECGPFKRWVLTVEPNAVERQPAETWAAIDAALGDAMAADDARGASGEWVAVLGFSQGAKIAASLLLRQQWRGERGGFRFGVLMAGRGPLLPVDPEGDGWLDEKFDYATNQAADRVLRVPTIHFHGLEDPGLGYHQVLLEEWCDPTTTALLEWDGGHRLPFKTPDVKLVVDKILEFAKQTGVPLKA